MDEDASSCERLGPRLNSRGGESRGGAGSQICTRGDGHRKRDARVRGPIRLAARQTVTVNVKDGVNLRLRNTTLSAQKASQIPGGFLDQLNLRRDISKPSS